MSFIVYNKLDNYATGVYDTKLAAENDSPTGDLHLSILEYEWKETDYLLSITLDADGVTLSNRFPGKTIDEQKSLIEAEDDALRATTERAFKVNGIKIEAADRIRELKWKMTRARDNDLVNGNSDSTAEVLAEVNSIRAKSNEAESALDALTSPEEVKAFKVKEQFN
jgi:hypothetical protein